MPNPVSVVEMDDLSIFDLGLSKDTLREENMFLFCIILDFNNAAKEGIFLVAWILGG